LKNSNLQNLILPFKAMGLRVGPVTKKWLVGWVEPVGLLARPRTPPPPPTPYEAMTSLLARLLAPAAVAASASLCIYIRLHFCLHHCPLIIFISIY
jgi:hypothetical protein